MNFLLSTSYHGDLQKEHKYLEVPSKNGPITAVSPGFSCDELAAAEREVVLYRVVLIG